MSPASFHRQLLSMALLAFAILGEDRPLDRRRVLDPLHVFLAVFTGIALRNVRPASEREATESGTFLAV